MRAVGLVLALCLASSCSLFNREYPSDECSVNADCFRAMGEQCVDGTCQVPPDAMPAADARPRPDAPPPVDASPPDAAPADAGAPDGGAI